MLSILNAAAQRRAVVLSRPVMGTQTIDLEERCQEPEHHFSSRRRADFRTVRRRLEKLGRVSFGIEVPSLEKVPALFEEVVAVEASG